MKRLMRLWPAVLGLCCPYLVGSDSCTYQDYDDDEWTTDQGDCDDYNSQVYPGAKEVCDGVDNNCNGQLDEGYTSVWYTDSDGDGFGASTTAFNGCESPGSGYSSNNADCDDTRSSVYPSALEVCDDVDNDCDGFAPDTADSYFRDMDEDGQGDPTVSLLACDTPTGFVSNALDCLDRDATVSTQAVEVCNGIDDNCDLLIDENLPLYYRDNDQDGFGSDESVSCLPSEGWSSAHGDCDDANSESHPGALDTSSDGIDSDCGGTENAEPHVGFPNSTYATLLDALEAATQDITIWVGPGTYLEMDLSFHGKTLALRSTDGPENTTIDAAGAGRLFGFVEGEAQGAVLDGFTLTHGYADAGGAILVRGSSPTLRHLIVTESSSAKGGGILLESSNTLLEYSQIYDNTAAADCEEYVEVRYDAFETIFSYNCTTLYGGAGIYIYSGSPILKNVQLLNNAVTVYRGYDGYSSSDGTQYTITDISAPGAGIYIDSSNLTLESVSILNSAALNGAGLYASNSKLIGDQLSIIQNSSTHACTSTVSSWEDNEAYDSCRGGIGGGAYISGGTFDIQDLLVRSNTAKKSAGGLYITGASGQLERAYVVGSSTGYLGTVTYDSSGLYLTDVASSLGGYGGGIAVISSTLNSNNTVIADNVAPYSGGGLQWVNSTGTQSQLILSGNTASGISMWYSMEFDSLKTSTSTTKSQISYIESGDIPCGGKGGNLLMESGSLTLNSSKILQGRAGSEAGGTDCQCNYQYYPAQLSPGNGGGGYIFSGTLKLQNTVVSGNSAETAEMAPPEYEEEIYSTGRGAGLFIQSGSSIISNSILSYNTHDTVYVYGGSTQLSYSDLYTSAGTSGYNLSYLAASNQVKDPSFQEYAFGYPVDFHLSLSSPLINQGNTTETDADGSRTDLGCYGGKGGSAWDLDGDGYHDWFWPGTFEDASSAIDSSSFDSDDVNPRESAP